MTRHQDPRENELRALGVAYAEANTREDRIRLIQQQARVRAQQANEQRRRQRGF